MAIDTDMLKIRRPKGMFYEGTPADSAGGSLFMLDSPVGKFDDFRKHLYDAATLMEPMPPGAVITSASTMAQSDWETALEFERIANRSTRARRKAEAMGFVFDRVSLSFNAVSPGQRECWDITMNGSFKCVCGTQEVYRTFVVIPKGEPLDSPYVLDELDPAAFLWRYGSFNEDHLRGDGYSAQTIEGFKQKAQRFESHEAMELLRDAQLRGAPMSVLEALTKYTTALVVEHRRVKESDDGHVSDWQAAHPAHAPVCPLPGVAVQPKAADPRVGKPRANDPWYRRFAGRGVRGMAY